MGSRRLCYWLTAFPKRSRIPVKSAESVYHAGPYWAYATAHFVNTSISFPSPMPRKPTNQSIPNPVDLILSHLISPHLTQTPTTAYSPPPTPMPPRLPIHITLFTRAQCALCTTAHSNLARAWQLRPFEFTQIDVMALGQERWKAAYV